MNIAFIIGGWYFPKHLYKNAIEINKPEGSNIDYFTVTHRNPELVDIKSEMIPRIANKNKYDLELFNDIATYSDLIEMGYKVDEVENAIGDYYFFNQWAELYDYTKYDYIVFMHDDNYLLPEFKDILTDVFDFKSDFYKHDDSNWIRVGNVKKFNYIANSAVLKRKTARGSFSIWSKDLIDKLGGKFPMDKVEVNRTGLSDTPNSYWALDWNAVGTNLQNFIQDNGFMSTTFRLSPYYRISRYMIEGERGLISNTHNEIHNEALSYSFNSGMKNYIK